MEPTRRRYRAQNVSTVPTAVYEHGVGLYLTGYCGKLTKPLHNLHTTQIQPSKLFKKRFFHITFETCNVYGKKQHASNARQNKKEPYDNIYCDPFYAVFVYLFIS